MTSLPEAPAPATRQWLSKRQSATVEFLLKAGLTVLRERGYDDLSLREVAARAGVTHTTAYSYFSSKDHLIAEMYWRRLRDTPVPAPDQSAPLADRLVAALESASVVVATEDTVARGILAALVSADPDTAQVRDRIGSELGRRITEALGSDVDPRVTEGVLLLFSGAMLQAGLGYFGFEEVVDRIRSVVSVWDPASAPRRSV
jgi:AcrR family transcriptional regulator